MFIQTQYIIAIAFVIVINTIIAPEVFYDIVEPIEIFSNRLAFSLVCIPPIALVIVALYLITLLITCAIIVPANAVKHNNDNYNL